MLKTHKILLASAVMALTSFSYAQTANPASSTTNVDVPQSTATMPAPDLSATQNPPTSGMTGPASAATSTPSTANLDAPQATAAASGTAKTSTDPFVQRRIDKKEAKDEYKAKKKVAKMDYKAEKKEANANLKAAQKAGETTTPADPVTTGK